VLLVFTVILRMSRVALTPMKKWEYMKAQGPGMDIDATDALGEEGWELVSASLAVNAVDSRWVEVLWFKRPLE
jgi:hypothetical protein